MSENLKKSLMAGSVEELLAQIDPEGGTRAGLQETPGRVAAAWVDHWAAGYRVDPRQLLKTFEDGAEDYDEIVLEKNIPVYSHCEHHLAPFFGVAHVAYIPSNRIVGLSKLARVVDAYARRLQVQERLTRQVAMCIEEALEPKGVAVVIECRHMCMESRGVARQGITTVTSKMLGVFLTGSTARAEFLSLIGRQ